MALVPLTVHQSAACPRLGGSSGGHWSGCSALVSVARQSLEPLRSSPFHLEDSDRGSRWMPELIVQVWWFFWHLECPPFPGGSLPRQDLLPYTLHPHCRALPVPPATDSRIWRPDTPKTKPWRNPLKWLDWPRTELISSSNVVKWCIHGEKPRNVTVPTPRPRRFREEGSFVLPWY